MQGHFIQILKYCSNMFQYYMESADLNNSV